MATWDLGGNAGNSFAFDTVGDTVTGTVLDMAEVQQTDMDTGLPATWDNGQPKMMYRVDLQTQARDPNDPADDGKRSVYLRGSRKPESQSSLAAVLTAVRQATGTANLATGGILALRYVGDGQPTRRGFNAPKLYAAQYTPPANNLGEAPQPIRQEAPPLSPQQQFAQQQATQGPAPDWAQPQPAPQPVQQPQQWPARPAQQAAAPQQHVQQPQQWPAQPQPAPQPVQQQQQWPAQPAQQAAAPQQPVQQQQQAVTATMPQGVTPEMLQSILAAQQSAAGAQQA